MGWQSAWELYQDEHIDADWDDFERDYWGDNSEEEDDADEKCTYWDTEGEIYVLSPYGMEHYAGADFDTIQEIGRAEWENDNVDEDDSEDEDDYGFDEDEEDEDYDIMHPNETREEFLEHENFD